MRLLCITDLHGDHQVLEAILTGAGAVDLVLLGGDLTNFGTPNVAERIVRQVQQRQLPLLAVAGNCDSAAIDQRLTELGVSVFGRGVICGELGVYGVSAMPPWQGTMYELSEQQIAAALELGRRQLETALPPRATSNAVASDGGSNAAGEKPCEVLLSHTPPRETVLDRTRHGQHVGSTAVRDCILRWQPRLVVCGHIHEARGVAQLGASQLVNCGPAFRGCYALAELNRQIDRPVRIDLCQLD